MTTNSSENIEKLRSLIEGIDIAMFVTVSLDGSLHGRPMSTQQAEFDGDLWFFTSKNSEKLSEIAKQPKVTIQYQDIKKQRYVSVSGEATVLYDREKIEELWKPIHKAWFPEGKDDPELTLVKVSSEKAEYWDAPGGPLVQIIGFAKAVATGDSPDDVGEHKKVTL